MPSRPCSALSSTPGAGYLCFVGVNLLRGAWRRVRPAGPTPAGPNPAGPMVADATATDPTGATATGPGPHAPAEGAQESAAERNPFRRALLISLLNPKAILFFVSFFIQFVRPDAAHAWLSFLILGTIVEVCSALYLTALIFMGSYLADQFRRRRRLSRALSTGLAALFVGFAAKLATASLS